MQNLKSKYGNWALITGASSGIGEEFAKSLASLGINLVLVARRKERLEKLADYLINLYGIEVVTSSVDISKDDFIEKIEQDIYGRDISILVNNAGIGKPGEFITGDIKYDSEMIYVNCIAPIVLTKHFGKKMVERKKGAIIFIGSVVAYQPTPLMSTYAATKAFIFSLGNSLWYELKSYGIDILTVHPGNTSTEFQRMILNDESIFTRKASQVVRTTLNALGRKPNVVDGIINKMITMLSKIGTVRIIASITGLLMNSFYKKNYLSRGK